jgi:hypothetical protein
MDLQGVIDELYGAPPERFTARRDELAKEAAAGGDKDLAATVRSLRRPTAAAWVVNSLARQAPEAVAALVELGQRMREAQSILSGTQMRALSRERQQVLAGLVGRATALAGGSVSPSVSQEVEQTLRAAVADRDASAAVQSGCLTHGLSYTGLGPVGRAATARHLQAVPGTATDQKRRVTAGGGDTGSAGLEAAGEADQAAERRREHVRELAEAESALRSSERAAGAAATRADRARRRHEEAEQEVAELERARQAATETAAKAGATADTAVQQATAAEAVVRAAREEVERIRSLLDGS